MARIYVFTKKQAKKLPDFSNDLKIDGDREDRVREVYRTAPKERSAAFQNQAVFMLELFAQLSKLLIVKVRFDIGKLMPNRICNYHFNCLRSQVSVLKERSLKSTQLQFL